MKIGSKTFKTSLKFFGIDFSIIYSWIRINKRLKYSDHALKWLPFLFLSWQKSTKTFHPVHYVHFFHINSRNLVFLFWAMFWCRNWIMQKSTESLISILKFWTPAVSFWICKFQKSIVTFINLLLLENN